ncbi:hypothetical protein [Hymenobacter sp. BT190]|uniref:hypothetical protein n=1 Tax=Hymenobacter sp. BT190 TaxID=2763505 RepID=UPI00165160A7|nr:hypothetical protein [Hymenobacter sp. BT190]MBC6700577.1 hypothetical protein [Hymenobacter sp. BT190]
MSLLRSLALAAFPLFLVGVLLLELVGPVAPATMRAARSARASLVQRSAPIAPVRMPDLAAY